LVRLLHAFAVLVISFSLTGGASADDATFPWQDIGAQTYAGTCAACHQTNGEGVASTFPPLAGHAAKVVSRPGGRDYVIRLVLFGLEGPIVADGKPFNQVMPAWEGILNDEQLAGALDYALNSWGNDKALPVGFQPITPAEIAASRPTKMTATGMHELRERIMPDAATTAPLLPATFTQEQADRGHASYRRYCQDCHGSNLDNGEFGGAPLTGLYFARHWSNGTVAALYGFIRTKMPPDRPGKLNPQTYADLAAFLLSRNGYSADQQADLPPDPAVQERMGLQR
jgi:mono/diheme cytochrome c family protein